MSRKNGRPPLLVKVWAELGAGRITEDVRLTSSQKHERLEGLEEGRHIWVNPLWNIVDTTIHEILHRLHPEWSETYVRRTTTFLLHRMTDAEAQMFYDEYQQRAKKAKKRQRRDRKVPSSGGRLVAERGGEADVQEVRRGPDDPRSD